MSDAFAQAFVIGLAVFLAAIAALKLAATVDRLSTYIARRLFSDRAPRSERSA